MEARENAALPREKYLLDRSLCHPPPVSVDLVNYRVCYSPWEWVGAVRLAAEKYGFDDCSTTPEAWKSILQLQAAQVCPAKSDRWIQLEGNLSRSFYKFINRVTIIQSLHDLKFQDFSDLESSR
jgi:hypothetical protein